MRSQFRNLLLNQLDRRLEPYRAARKVSRPAKGWIRAIRQALGVSSASSLQVGNQPSAPAAAGKGWAEDRITLKSLRAMAHALDCELVYALVPHAGSFARLNEDRARDEAKQRVLGVEHSMALENQAAGRIDEAIETETRRLVDKRIER